MDAASIRQQILSFRLVELREAATQLSLCKTGAKAVLQSRLLGYLGEAEPPAADRRAVAPPSQQWRFEKAARVVHDIYCRRRGLPNTSSDQSTADQFVLGRSGSGAAAAANYRPPHTPAVPAYAGAGLPHPAVHPPVAGGNAPVAEGVEAALLGGPRLAGGPRGRLNTQIRCICQVQTERGQMIQCEDPTCGVWQHCDCLGLGGSQPAPASFYCEVCRARLADPFWEPLDAPLLPPSRLKAAPGRAGFLTTQGMQEVQVAERAFFLSAAQLDPVKNDPANYRLQLACLEMGDAVQFRYHWPRHMDLRVNNMPYRPYNRSTNAKMGINQRDEPASIGALCVRGRNSLNVTAADSGIWLLVLQLARKRSMSQVKAHMAAPETLSAAVAHVRRLVSGSPTEGEEEEEDEELLVSHQVVSLKDPMSGQRMQVPARFRDASGLQCFDLDTFLSMVERNRKWQDPTTLRNSTLPQLQIDTYTLRVLQCLASAPHVSEIELAADGHWRPAGTEGPWFSVQEDPKAVAAQLPTGVKPDPEGAAAGGPAADGGVLSSDEEDEEEELRQAARAVAAQNGGLAGQKRKEPDVEVIDLLDSDDELAAAPPARQHSQISQQQPAGAAAGAGAAGGAGAGPPPGGGVRPSSGNPQHPLRIKLPIRLPPRQAAAAGGLAAAEQQQQQQARQAAAQQQPGAQPMAVGGLAYQQAVPQLGIAQPGQVPVQAYPPLVPPPPGMGSLLAASAGMQQAGAYGSPRAGIQPLPQGVVPVTAYGSGALGIPQQQGLPPYMLQPVEFMPQEQLLFTNQAYGGMAAVPPLQQPLQQPAAMGVYRMPPAQPPAMPVGFVPASQLLTQQQQQQQQRQRQAGAVQPARPAGSEDALDAFMRLLDDPGPAASLEDSGYLSGDT